MSKKGMASPDRTQQHPKNEVFPVPQIQGKAKTGNQKLTLSLQAPKVRI